MAGSSTGVLALRNVAQKSIAFSSSMVETRARVLSLHRDFLRSVPWIKRTYKVPMTDDVRPLLRLRGGSTPFWSLPPVRSRRRLDARSRPVAQKIRSLITDAFKEKQAEADISQVNRLIIKGRMELEEVRRAGRPNPGGGRRGGGNHLWSGRGAAAWPLLRTLRSRLLPTPVDVSQPAPAAPRPAGRQ